MIKWGYFGRAGLEETKTRSQNVKLFSKAQQLTTSSRQTCEAGAEAEQKQYLSSALLFNHRPSQPPNKSMTFPQSVKVIAERIQCIIPDEAPHEFYLLDLVYVQVSRSSLAQAKEQTPLQPPRDGWGTMD